MEKIEKKVNAMCPQREQLRRCVEAALAASSDEFLEGCRIEVVGSTAWGGEVPQSDLDLVLVTATSAAAPPQALELLTLLRDSLEKQSEGERHWRLELVEARKVPLLRLYDQQGLSCDVVVDQMHAIQHRKLLQEALTGRNELKTCIRLIKYWLRQRGLPIGAEGGLPSFAWAYTALQLATDLPPGTSVERLLCHFFNSLSKLSERSLAVQYRERGVNVAWKARSDPTAWSQEFIELIWVDDPTRRQQFGVNASCKGMTPHSVPTALGALYIAEIRMAMAAIKEDRWEDLWKSATAEAKTSLPSVVKDKSKGPLHILLKDGKLTVGKLETVLRCPNVQNEELHRRDQSSELVFQCCTMKKDQKSDSTTLEQSPGQTLSCKPSHWVCALPTWNMKVKGEETQKRLAELLAFVRVASKQSPPSKPSKRSQPSPPPAPAAANTVVQFIPMMNPAALSLVLSGQGGQVPPNNVAQQRVPGGFFFCPVPFQYTAQLPSQQKPSSARPTNAKERQAESPRIVGLQKHCEDLSDSSGSSKSTETSESTETTETTEIADIGEITEITEITEIPDIPDIPEITEDTPATPVPEISEDHLKANSDDSTRASDSEEFAPVRPRRGYKVRKPRSNQEAVVSEPKSVNSTQGSPKATPKASPKTSPGRPKAGSSFNTFKALNVDVPTRRPSVTEGTRLSFIQKKKSVI